MVAVPYCKQSSAAAVAQMRFTDIAEQLSAADRIIGKGGETVRALQSYSGAMIQVTAGQLITSLTAEIAI